MLNTINASSQQCECGLVLNFQNPKDSLPLLDQYVLTFSVESFLPSDPAPTITLDPSTYVINKTKDFVPKIIAKVESVHRGETQALIKLIIKDIYNKTLSTQYAKLVCSPQDVIILTGTILTNTQGSNGGSLMNVSSTSGLEVGMSVSGPLITGSVSIVTILSNQVELSSLITGNGSSGTYIFSKSGGCADPRLKDRGIDDSKYIKLNSSNNYTYKVNDKILLKFIPEDNNDTIELIFKAKNKSLLPKITDKSNIPSVANVKVGGRTNNGQCIS